MCKQCQSIHHKPPVRTWKVRYHEKGFDYSMFYAWFHTQRAAQAFAAKHQHRNPLFAPVISHVDYLGGHHVP